MPQGTVQVVERWGKFSKFAEPGCHLLIPCAGDAISGALSTRIQSLDVACETKTKDNVFVTIICSTQYMVQREADRMYDAYKLTDCARDSVVSSTSSVHRAAHQPRRRLHDEEIAAMTEFGFTTSRPS